MDDFLPSYESVISRDPWNFIAPYLQSEDLCSVSLVCQKWHEAFAPSLWGNPASHFGVQNDTVYVALTRFKRVLPYVRPAVRVLTHTLCFPPAHAEIYGGPHAEWLRDCLEYLPKLQCIIVRGLPFFDHAALLSLRHSSLRIAPNGAPSTPLYGLRLLDASNCKNVTSTGLTECLRHFPDLVYLDLSRTPAAKDENVLSRLKLLLNLRILKLSALGLKDADLRVIATCISTRVVHLDVSENSLTDVSARLLLEHCVKDTVLDHSFNRGPLSPVDDQQLRTRFDSCASLKSAEKLYRTLTRGFAGSLTIEQIQNVGITQLYLTGNKMTVEGISGLLRSRRLQHLDVGVLPATWETFRDSIYEKLSIEHGFPGISKLLPTLREYAATQLEYLRINYRILIEDGPKDAVLSPRAELPGTLCENTYLPNHELPVTDIFTTEIDSTEHTLYELAGDSVQPTELPIVARLQLSVHEATRDSHVQAKLPVSSPSIKIGPGFELENLGRSSRLGPDDLESLDACADKYFVALRGSDGGAPNPQDTVSKVAPESSLDSNPLLSPITDLHRTRSRQNSTHFVEDRRARLDLRQAQVNRLRPGTLPRLRTLVLTDVPISTTDKTVVERLKQYIMDAAEEAAIATQRAMHTYALPPGRSRRLAEQEYASSLFGLQRIVLEMAVPQGTQKTITSSWRSYPTKSSTEDPDSEAFWDAAAHDFSFFGDEECGLPSLEPARTQPLAAMSGLEVVTSQEKPPPQHETTQVESQPVIDVIQEISNFRKDRKATYANLVYMGEANPDVEGYWPGEITVVRKVADPDGQQDCYGNRYESGWYYR